MTFADRFGQPRYFIPFIVALAVTLVSGINHAVDYTTYHGEISASEYTDLHDKAQVNPALIPAIQKAMTDGKIDGYEVRDILALNNRRGLIYARGRVLTFGDDDATHK